MGTGHGQGVTGREVQWLGEAYGTLPIEVPHLHIEELLLSTRASISNDSNGSSQQVHVTGSGVHRHRLFNIMRA